MRCWRVAAFAALLCGATSLASAQAIEVTEASITDLQTALASRRTTSVQLVDQYLARIRAYDHAGPELNAIIRLNPRARAEAATLDAERRRGQVRGPLHGIPIILKDNYDTGDLPTSAGSLAMATSQPAQDGFIVRQLRAAGAVVLAKANLHELAAGITTISSLGGQTRNPYDPTRCPGGSSGGTGAAIAASLAAVGWGSDTCGSIRIPSAFGSLVGLRPTIGLTSRTGIVPLSHTQDIGGPLARTVTDLAIALDATIGYDPTDATTAAVRDRPPHFQAALDPRALAGAKIGVFLPYFRDTDGEIADTVRSALAVMKAQGATLIDVPMAEFDTLIANTSVINLETKFDLADYLATVPHAPVRSLTEIVNRGLFDRQLEVRFRSIDTLTQRDTPVWRLALARQAQLRARMEHVMDSLGLDAIAYPTMRQKPVAVGDVQPGGTCNLSAQSGLPAISMPAGFTADGLPVGLELLGKRFSDVRLVSVAYAFERTGPRRRPPSTTPPLVAGRAPVAVPVVIATRSAGLQATTRLTVDEVRNELRWTASVQAAPPAAIAALVLRRRGGGIITGPATSTIGNAPTMARVAIPDSAMRVVFRMLGPTESKATGVVPLTAADRIAFRDGRLTVMLVPANGQPPVETSVRLSPLHQR